MGLLQEGKWVDRWYQTKDTGGRFVRNRHHLGIGSLQTVMLGPQERAALKPK